MHQAIIPIGPGHTLEFVLIRFDITNLQGVLIGAYSEKRFAEAKKVELETKAQEIDSYAARTHARFYIFRKEQSIVSEPTSTTIH